MKASQDSKGKIPVGLLSTSSHVLVSSYASEFPKQYSVERISLDQLSMFSEQSKLGTLKDLKALVVDGVEEDLQVFRLAYLIKRTYPAVKLVLITREVDARLTGKSHFDAYVDAYDFKENISTALNELRVGKEDIFSRFKDMLKRVTAPKPVFFA